MVDTWESKQKEYKRTLFVLESIDRRIERQFSARDKMEEMPRTVLVCGGDMLESMNRPDIWDQDLLEVRINDINMMHDSEVLSVFKERMKKINNACLV